MTIEHAKPLNRLQIGAVSYLNTKPLVHGLEQAVSEFADLSFAVPSALSEKLAAGRLDVALVPVIELLRHPEWSILSDACIACRGPVWSVQTLFRTRPSQVKSLAVDEGSRTSAALTQILLYERFGVLPEVRPLPLESSVLDSDADAMLVIGDRAMHLDRLPGTFAARWDLGQEWLETTGLPFVFAAWICRQGSEAATLAEILSARRDAGLRSARSLAEECAPQYELSGEAIERYFVHHLRFQLGADERRGLDRFLQKADELGLGRSQTLVPRDAEPVGR